MSSLNIPVKVRPVSARRPAAYGLVLLILAVLTVRGSPPSPAHAAQCDLPDPNTQIAFSLVTGGLRSPVYVTHAGDDRLFIVEQEGYIRIFEDRQLRNQPFLDIHRRVESGGEKGLLSVAFHPNYAANGRFFVNYTRRVRTQLKTFISEYHVSPDDPNRADPTEKVILRVDQPFDNHNGGLNKFGPEGYLYIGMGDGGSGGDPFDNGQDLGTLLGKVLRIDIDGGDPYAIPRGNPFSRWPGARGEIWAYGLRNPWRFSFDRCDGRLFLGDVGQFLWEEIDLVTRGDNLGWRLKEGDHCFNPSSGCEPAAGLVDPIAEYSHSFGCSVTGGHVYRGTESPDLVGRYFFGDYCSGRIWQLVESDPGRWTMTELLDSNLRISSFGEDENGEVYVVDHNGSVYRLIEQ